MWNKGVLAQRNLIRNGKRREVASAHQASQSCYRDQHAQTEGLTSAQRPKIRENRCLLSFLASGMTYFSYSLFQLPVPTSRKPQKEEKNIEIWSTIDGKHVCSCQGPSKITDVEWSLDSSRFISKTTKGDTQIWQLI